MFKKVLIANRGEIACRVIQTLRRLGVTSVAIYSEADSQSMHVAMADEAHLVGPALAQKSYLDVDRILDIAGRTGAEAIHPGYGFLSENPDFARRCQQRGVKFIGPSVTHIEAFGLKHEARRLAQEAGVPLLPGSPLLDTPEAAEEYAERIGYPIMLKSTAGGGGIGLVRIHEKAQIREAFASSARLSKSHFSHAGVFLEKYVEHARHIEVQIFGDGRGRVMALGERDCSLQRRNQKVIEQTPAPLASDETRQGLHQSAVALMRSVRYASAGTVEFIYDQDSGAFYFLEVNTRLQVEHTVTEEVFGIDVVEWMLLEAAGLPIPHPFGSQVEPRGHSLQARVYAEMPAQQFRPSSGLVTQADFPATARVETWVEAGVEVSPHYDPLIAKIIVRGDTRAEALEALDLALAQTRISGIETNVDYLRAISSRLEFREGTATTRLLESLPYSGRGVSVITPGTQSTLQDYPGRVGYWHVGIPPSGPMDSLSLRLGNRAVGNPEGFTGLEMTVQGAHLRFDEPTVFCLSGAHMAATLDGEPVKYHEPVNANPGAILAVGSVDGPGLRTYLCVRGGFDVPEYLGSRSTFTLGGFGGHGGRALLAGDVLHVGSSDDPRLDVPLAIDPALPETLTREWELAVLYGPHGAPDFFTPADMETFFSHRWEVHYNSARTGVRLVGPEPQWARSDGGEAGLHPSNIHDCAYAVGAVDFTGDTPILLGPDGPSLGGFVCPATVVEADLHKLGQLRPGDTVRFVCISEAQAEARRAAQDARVAARRPSPERPTWQSVPADSAVLLEVEATERHARVVFRRSGDRHLLVEYGPNVLDLNLRFQVHALMQWVKEQELPGVDELTPGIRSLQLRLAPGAPDLLDLCRTLANAERSLPPVKEMVVPTRIVHMPLSWDDGATQLAIRKYDEIVRKNAPWAPSNIEFIRRINGLDDVEDVKRIVFDASYLVMGLGDVYLGAPVATPVDPRHRLVTTKYNPARTWTPENAVGIGGAYLCIYGMEGPGGYQFVGRTLQVFNRFRQTRSFVDGKPWLLRFFDQIRFYPVSQSDLLQLRREFLAGRFNPEITSEEFDLAEYNRFLKRNEASITAFKKRQEQAFHDERERWKRDGQLNFTAQTNQEKVHEARELPPGVQAVPSPVPGSVWKVSVKAGDRVSAGQSLLVLESMKMEVALEAPVGGTVHGLLCTEGQPVTAGQALVTIEE